MTLLGITLAKGHIDVKNDESMHMHTVRGGLVCLPRSIHHGFEQQTFNNKVSALVSFCFDF